MSKLQAPEFPAMVFSSVTHFWFSITFRYGAYPSNKIYFRNLTMGYSQQVVLILYIMHDIPSFI